MSRVWIFLGVAMCLALGIAKAAPAAPLPPASFDCAKAPGVDERVICGDPLLRQADHALGQAYQAARAAATDKARLRADEHGWVMQRDRECGVDKFTLLTADNLPRFSDCFLGEYDERMGDLRQMRLHPGEDPQSISHPIRKVFPDIAPAPSNAPFVTIPILPGQDITAFAWRLTPAAYPFQTLGSDESLAALVMSPDDSEGVFSTESDASNVAAPGANHSIRTTKIATIPGPIHFTALCGLPNGDIVLSQSRNGPFGMISKAGFANRPTLPADIQATCNLAPNQMSIGDGNGHLLKFGPVKAGVQAEPRFISITSGAITKTVEPPIRIDSRSHFSAYFQAWNRKFIVYQDTWPPGTDDIMERRWEKTNCAAYYEIDADTEAATSYCVPFGPFATAAPHPLILPQRIYYSDGDQTSVPLSCPNFFYERDSGIWSLDGKVFIAKTSKSPQTAADGCFIAALDENGSLQERRFPFIGDHSPMP
jgi:uncharacterized protein YecT (DUF1311 family)